MGLVTKYYGAYFGGRLAGVPRKESIVAGFGMSTRGSMDIVLGLIALENGLVTEPLFIGLVILAIIASMSAGPLIGWARNLKI